MITQLQAEREAKSWSRDDLAFKSTITDKTILNIETEKPPRKRKTQKRIRVALAKALRCKMSNLFDAAGIAIAKEATK